MDDVARGPAQFAVVDDQCVTAVVLHQFSSGLLQSLHLFDDSVEKVRGASPTGISPKGFLVRDMDLPSHHPEAGSHVSGVASEHKKLAPVQVASHLRCVVERK